MFKRKLQALDYMYWDKVDGSDEQHFRKLVVWLEEQKIRHYTIGDRSDLRAIANKTWNKSFEKYLQDLDCPVSNAQCNLNKLEWLLGLAVRLEFEDDLTKYKEKKIDNKDIDPVPSIKSTNQLDNLNFEDNQFKDGIVSLSKLLEIPQHPDHFVTLEACSKFISQRLNSAATKNPQSYIIKGQPFPISEKSADYGFNDKLMNETVAALDLLYIQDLRNLQTAINESIVAVQNITADPKTDTKAGRVGI